MKLKQNTISFALLLMFPPIALAQEAADYVPEDEGGNTIVQNQIITGNNSQSPEMIMHQGGLRLYYHDDSGIKMANCSGDNNCSGVQTVINKGSFAFLGDPTVILQGNSYLMFMTGVASGDDPATDNNRKLYYSTSNSNSGTTWSTPQLLANTHEKPSVTSANGTLYLYASKNSDTSKVDRLTLSSNGSSVTNTSAVSIDNANLYGYYSNVHVRFNTSSNKFQILSDRITSSGESVIDYFESDNGTAWNIILERAIERQENFKVTTPTTHPNNFELTYFAASATGNTNFNILNQAWEVPVDIDNGENADAGSFSEGNEDTTVTDPNAPTYEYSGSTGPSGSDSSSGSSDTGTNFPTDGGVSSCPSTATAVKCGEDQRIDFTVRRDENGCFLPPQCVDKEESSSSNPFSALMGGPGLFSLFQEKSTNEDHADSDSGKTTEKAAAETERKTYSTFNRRSLLSNRDRSTATRTQSLRSRIQSLKFGLSSQKSSKSSEDEERSEATAPKANSTANRLKAMKTGRTSERYNFFTRRSGTGNPKSPTNRSRRSSHYGGYKVYEN